MWKYEQSVCAVCVCVRMNILHMVVYSSLSLFPYMSCVIYLGVSHVDFLVLITKLENLKKRQYGIIGQQWRRGMSNCVLKLGFFLPNLILYPLSERENFKDPWFHLINHVNSYSHSLQELISVVK